MDFDNARTRAIAFDAQLLGSASAVSSVYANLVSVSARLAIGGTELTIGNGTDGTWNMSDVKMFMKDVGTSRYVSEALPSSHC